MKTGAMADALRSWAGPSDYGFKRPPQKSQAQRLGANRDDNNPMLIKWVIFLACHLDCRSRATGSEHTAVGPGRPAGNNVHGAGDLPLRRRALATRAHFMRTDPRVAGR